MGATNNKEAIKELKESLRVFSEFAYAEELPSSAPEVMRQALEYIERLERELARK